MIQPYPQSLPLAATTTALVDPGESRVAWIALPVARWQAIRHRDNWGSALTEPSASTATGRADHPEVGIAKPLGAATVARYAIGSLGTGGFSTLPGLVLVYYLTDTLGVAAFLAGLVIGVPKIWDVLIGPVVGRYSDRQLQHRGSRRRYMLAGALILPLFFIATFAAPATLTPALSALWVFTAFLIASTAFSLFQVPYIALPAELSDSYDQRTQLLTWRVVVLAIAILLFGAGGPALRALGGDNPHAGYLWMAAIAAAVICVGMLICISVAPKNLPAATARAPEQTSLWAHYAACLRALRESQPFRVLLLAYVLQGMAAGEMLAAVNYVATWILGNSAAVSFLFVALIGPLLLVTPLWGQLARRIGKERSYLYATGLFALGTLSMLALIWWPGSWVYGSVMVCGIGYAGMNSLPLAMLPDVMSHDARCRGRDRAGVLGGLWTAGETGGMALGATVLAAVLALTGYAAHSGETATSQSPEALIGIVLSFSLVPALLVAASLLPLLRYRLRKEDIDV